MGRSESQNRDALNLQVVHPDAAGIDIGNAGHYVAVPPDRDAEPVRSFGCLHPLGTTLRPQFTLKSNCMPTDRLLGMSGDPRTTFQLFGQGDKVPAPSSENFASAFTTLDSASVNCSDSKVRGPAPFSLMGGRYNCI